MKSPENIVTCLISSDWMKSYSETKINQCLCKFFFCVKSINTDGPEISKLVLIYSNLH